MIDKSVPNYPVFMTKNDIVDFPKFELPEGLHFEAYKAGTAIDWARLQMYYLQYANYGEALSYFKKMYIDQGVMIYDRVIFVKDKDDFVVASGALWIGTHFGNVMHKLSGFAVHPEFRHKGIAMAMGTRLFEIANELECKGGLYTNMSTWNYPCINLMFKLGFVAYVGRKPKNYDVPPEEFAENNERAWGIVMSKIAEYNKKHVDAENDQWGAL